MDEKRCCQDPEAMGIAQHANFLSSVERNGAMEVSMPRFDHWLVKGFDGITDQLQTRSNMSKAVTPFQLDQLERALVCLEDAQRCEHRGVSEDTDDMMCTSVLILATLLRRRCFELNMKTLSQSEKKLLGEYIVRLRVAIHRLKMKLSSAAG
jgi:hypothetical protein